jgi:4-diphosphocytidyl-2-C-methyl-D-erythritol kinase
MTLHDNRILAPAKINLFLRILGRRADGYHLLDSVMLPVTLFDELDIELELGQLSDMTILIDVKSPSIGLPSGTDNLAFRAAAFLLEKLRQPARVRIKLRKNIPVGGGLGGGSSDAAAVLCRLNRLLGEPLGTEELAALGARLGADVPFFVYGTPARIGGAGEVVQPLTFPSPLCLVVCSGGAFLSTRDVYARVDLSLTSGRPVSNIADFVSGRKPLSELLVNDLEAAVAQIHPGVLPLKTTLVELGASGALMTGSGSALFGVWPDLKSAGAAAVKLRERGLWAQPVQTLSRSPVVEH